MNETVSLVDVATGKKKQVKIPDPLRLTRFEGPVLKRWVARRGDSDYLNALQSWAYRNGYEPPEKLAEGVHPRLLGLQLLREKKTNVKQHVRHSKTGKAYTVKQHERTIEFSTDSDKAARQATKFFKTKRRTEQEQEALQNYAVSSHYDLNSYFRDGGGKGEPDLDQIARRIESAFAKAAPLPADIFVYRALYTQHAKKFKPGGVYSDKAFVSTSLLAKHAAGVYDGDPVTVLKLRVPKGTKALYLDDGMTGKERELEVLLPRNIKLKIEQVTKPVAAWHSGARVKESFSESVALQEKKIWVKGYQRRREGNLEYVHPHERQLVTFNKVSPTERQFNGKPIKTKRRFTKSMLGKTGEALTIAALGGRYVNKYLKRKENNLAFDVINVRAAELYEVKAGAISNDRNAQKWRLTQDGKLTKFEQELLAKASPAIRKKYLNDKGARILLRKKLLKKELERRTGKKLTVKTIAWVINPDTQAADMYEVKGVHKIMRWHWPQAKYRKSFKWK